MPRLTNAAGVVVNVDDATAARLDSSWHPVGEKPKETAAQKRKREAEEKAAQDQERADVEAWLAAEREFVAAGGTAGGE
ncbi:DUF7302 family protein [Mycolicibacterium komossense]|uniref:Uncharacterized protein n=1 Tax=Mycolicibacterium komossense TaxID=1779 RepID=A0ABT3C9A4_9MYCO|nr:hypothetical protein [Mycolicibacterium komossense]MCV7226064.1 hypothetical protein [Mycolicibacterium komossense]